MFFIGWLTDLLALTLTLLNVSTLVSHLLPSLSVRSYSPPMLQCDNCTSHTSLEDCEKSQIKFSCGPSIWHRCYTLTRIIHRIADPNKTKQVLYIKGCFQKFVCDNFPYARNITHCGINETVYNLETCNLTCYTGTVLHFTPTPVGSGPEVHAVSVVMILACILLHAFWMNEWKLYWSASVFSDRLVNWGLLD